MICRRCKTVRSAKLSRVTNEHGPRPDKHMTTGRINQVAIRSKRGCCGTTGAPRFFSHVLRVHRYSNTTLAACTSSENRQFRTLPGDSSAILAPRHADSLPLDPTDRSKPRLSMGDRANSITSAHRARRQPRSILLRFALARAFAHYDCLLPHSSHRILHRHGTPERPRDRATSRPDLEFGKVRGRLPWPPNRAPAGHCAQLERLDSENISQRLDFNFLSRLEKISESKHRPAAKTFPRSKNPRSVKRICAAWAFGL
ncbi:unnamed protein product [Clavelina lepadiformis]|uniref:Uncharacterized protein n=1 Tax=Clavelina lepadiformis TaxID=159417 RepID=A0ABP0FLS4_CLALP